MEKIEKVLEESKQRYDELKNIRNKGFITKDEQLILHKGTLLHGIKFDEEKLKSISEKGLIGSDFLDSKYKNTNSNERFPKGVNFFRVPVDCFMDKYFEFYTNRIRGTFKSIKSIEEIRKTDGCPTTGPTHRKENDFLPRESSRTGIRKKDMAFIINPSVEIESLRENDPYQKGEKEFFRSSRGYYGYDEMFKNMKSRVANVLYGLPMSQISGVLISPDFEKEIKQIEFLKKTFPDVYITTSEGKVIYKGLEKEEKDNQPKKKNVNNNKMRRNVFDASKAISLANMVRDIKLGNTGEMHRYVSADGNKYLVKPAYKKGTKNQEVFRALAQRAAYFIQNIIDPSSAVVCNVKTIQDDKGQVVYGSIQDEVEGKNFKDIDGTLSEKFQKYGSQFLREFVTDYLLGNYDSHIGNFIVDKTGTLRGIDKEQSLKFIMNERTKNIDLNFSPNGLVHEPVYNKLFKMYEKGKIDLNLKEVSKYLDKIDKVQDDDYRKIFKLYADSRSNKEEERKKILDKIVERKSEAKNNINEFLFNISIKRLQNDFGINEKEVKQEVLKNKQKCIQIAPDKSMREIAYKKRAKDIINGSEDIKNNYNNGLYKQSHDIEDKEI